MAIWERGREVNKRRFQYPCTIPINYGFTRPKHHRKSCFEQMTTAYFETCESDFRYDEAVLNTLIQCYNRKLYKTGKALLEVAKGLEKYSLAMNSGNITECVCHYYETTTYSLTNDCSWYRQAFFV